ncbi:ASCH domain-containing protein [Carboxylicivirga marina]|uniref:ASCH domain-containing protein n=1 Tax=Carboxylicivirga marina TaxID=2800988 RepID=UPI0025948D73|nr:ASCH domain-containing protein [uncultured Carboxylicivirga sp.]
MRDTSTNVILSIKPVYANAIMEGIKKVEFRKKIFKRPVDKIFIYSSSPEMKFIGYFTVGKITEASPIELWHKFKDVGHINKQDFFEYYKDKSSGYSIGVKDFVKFEEAINPKDIFPDFYPPQSYQYINQKETSFILSKILKIYSKEKVEEELAL